MELSRKAGYHLYQIKYWQGGRWKVWLGTVEARNPEEAKRKAYADSKQMEPRLNTLAGKRLVATIM